MLLSEALGVQRGDIIAFTGAGGKTTAMLRLAYELRNAHWRVLATTTTRIAERELHAFPSAVTLDQVLVAPHLLSEYLNRYGLVFLHERIWGGKVLGIPPFYISELLDTLDSDVIMFEADGSRRLPLKAPHEHEPVLPVDTTLAVPVAGINAIGRPFDASTVYNLERIVERYGFPVGEPIHPAWIAQIMRDEMLGLKGIPPQARIVPLLNQVGTTVIERIKTRRIAQLILQNERIQGVAIGRVRRKKRPVFEVQRRVAAIVLAGGLSSRMGRSKPLLPWGKQTVIEAIVKRITPLKMAEMVVVTGYKAKEVKDTLKPLEIKTVYNKRYASGEMLSSLQAGLEALDDSISACLIFLGDQPNISPRLIHEILLAYAEGKGTIVAPSYNRRRGHPILIDRRYWQELMALPEGSAPRDVINAYSDEIAYVISNDDSILRDMDTPEEYYQELKRAGLL